MGKVYRSCKDRKALRGPSPQPSQTMNKISFSVSNEKISGNVFFPKKKLALNPAIIFIHGWTSKQDGYFYYATELAEKGYICMTFDMRGHGASEGNLSVLTRKDFLSDVIAAFDFLSQIKDVDKENITVVGSSFGGYLSVLLSSVRSCASLVLRVPANYPDAGFESIPHKIGADAYYEGLIQRDKETWKTTVHPYSTITSLQTLREFKGRVLLIESENDKIVPHEVVKSYSLALTDNAKLTYMVMKGADHSITRDKARQVEFLAILLKWLKDQ